MKRSRGFTWVESLVALVLLSLGMLGASAMLLGSLQAHAAALRELTALTLAQDMAERLRANLLSGTADPAMPELARFAAAARARLPGNRVATSVEFEPAIGPAAADRYDISVRWRAPRDDSDRVVVLHLLAAPVAG